MILSIIIPTYNEEEYLPVLLKSIEKQSFTDYEVIVADADSTDKTREIAKDYGCIVTDGGLPAVGRNNGAKIAKGEYLIFLDSDLELTDDYLRDVLYEFRMERLGIAITQMSPLSKKIEDKLFHDFANYFMISVEKIKPHGAGCYGIIARKELHDVLRTMRCKTVHEGERYSSGHGTQILLRDVEGRQDSDGAWGDIGELS